MSVNLLGCRSESRGSVRPGAGLRLESADLKIDAIARIVVECHRIRRNQSAGPGRPAAGWHCGWPQVGSPLFSGVDRVGFTSLIGQVDPALRIMREGKNIAVLEPDVAKAFRNSAAVNEALRSPLRISETTRRLTRLSSGRQTGSRR